jgi:hypothetical protein
LIGRFGPTVAATVTVLPNTPTHFIPLFQALRDGGTTTDATSRTSDANLTKFFMIFSECEDFDVARTRRRWLSNHPVCSALTMVDLFLACSVHARSQTIRRRGKEREAKANRPLERRLADVTSLGITSGAVAAGARNWLDISELGRAVRREGVAAFEGLYTTSARADDRSVAMVTRLLHLHMKHRGSDLFHFGNFSSNLNRGAAKGGNSITGGNSGRVSVTVTFSRLLRVATRF